MFALPSASTASNHAKPSWILPRDSHNACSDDASSNARSTSPVSMLQPNALRRDIHLFGWLARPGVGNPCGQAHRDLPPLRRSGRGGGSGRFGLAGLAELFQGVLTNGLQQPVSRCTGGVFGDDQRLVDEQAKLVEDLEALYLGAARNSLRRVEVESAQEDRQAGGTRHVRTRSATRATSRPKPATSADAAPPCARPPSAIGTGRGGCPTISSSESARTRAAASSIASGMPSRRRQISVTVAALSSVIAKPGRARRARSLNNSIASSASDSDGTPQLTSPGTRSGSRLVARIVTFEQAANMSVTSAALASSRCSQLSSTSIIWRSRTYFAAPCPWSSCPVGRAAQRPCDSHRYDLGWATGARSAYQTPSAVLERGRRPRPRSRVASCPRRLRRSR